MFMKQGNRIDLEREREREREQYLYHKKIINKRHIAKQQTILKWSQGG